MSPIDFKQHWEQVYTTKSPLEVSWYQQCPAASLELIEQTKLAQDEPIIDVGGGASTLVDHLLQRGYRNLTALDISAAALAHAQARLGNASSRVRWLNADVREFRAAAAYKLWHDRAVFHFLTDAADRARYVQALNASLAQGGCAIISTFALDGPTKCSGLPIAQYDEQRLLAKLGPGFTLNTPLRETHVTPWGAEQRFAYFLLERRG